MLLFLQKELAMLVTESMVLTIDRLPKEYIFTYEDFAMVVNQKEAVIKALNRMAKSGKIAKLSKGKYYKAETLKELIKQIS